MRTTPVPRFLTALVAVTRRFLDDQGFLLAAALSFSFLLCLAPLTLLLFSAAGFILESETIVEYVLESATYLLPGYDYEVLQAVALLTRERGVTSVLGAAGLMIFASQLFSLMRTVTNTAFRVSKRRGFIHGFAFDLFAVGVLGLLAVVLSVAMLTVVALGNVSLQFLPPLPFAYAGWSRLIALVLMYASLLVLLFFIYRTFPNTGVATRAAVVATIVVAVLWEGARWSLSAYLTRFGTYGRLYGSFGVVVATLVWIYYSAVIFVLGAELAALLTERTSGPPQGAEEAPLLAEPPPHRPAGMATYALVAVMAVVVAIFAVQNSARTNVRLLLWSIEGIPVAALVLLSLAIGILAAGAPLWIDRWRLRSEVRRLAARLKTPESAPSPRPGPPEQKTPGA
ncbi:MAG TPA: YhjD/YihY/BrkB family envelope integrity protein [Candidatus Methylomirabilis sp.]